MSTEDQEIAAMCAISEALQPLGPGEISRVLKWAQDRFGLVGELITALTNLAAEANQERDVLQSQLDAMTNAKPGMEVAS